MTTTKPWALIPMLALLAAPLLAQAHGVDPDAVRRCRALPDSAARLACYDGLPLPAPGAVAPATPAAGRSGTPAATAPAAAAPTPAPAVATAPAGGASSFGLEQQRRRDEVDEVSSNLIGRFQGWGPGTRFTLANGQVWQVSDDSSGLYELQSPKVTVRRAMLGSYMMEIEGARKAPRVRRVE